MARAPRPLAASAVGAVGGVASGLLGVGGGIVLVPAMVLLLGMHQRVAHATSLAAILPTSAVGAALFAAEGKTNFALFAALAAGSTLGAPIGVRLLARVPAKALRIGFTLLIVLAAARLLRGAGPAVGGRALEGPAEVATAFGAGILAGALAGLLGVGGGVVLVPAMTQLLGQAQRVAAGTSLLVIIPTAVAGTWANARGGWLDVRTAVPLGLGGAAGAAVGALVALHVVNETLLRRLFGALLVLVAVRMLRPGQEAAPVEP